MIIRRKIEHGFTTMPRAAFEDARLSYEARGVLGYILVKPDNWRVHVTDLARQAGPKGCGKDRIYRILDELKTAGYMTYSQGKAARGKFSAAEYVISDTPVDMADQPDTENPDTACFPDTDQPDTENPDAYKELTSTDYELDTPVGEGANDAPSGDASPIADLPSEDTTPAPTPAARRDQRHALGLLIAADVGIAEGDAVYKAGQQAGRLNANVGGMAGDVCKAAGGSYDAAFLVWDAFRDAIPADQWERVGSIGHVRPRFARWIANGGGPRVAEIVALVNAGRAA